MSAFNIAPGHLRREPMLANYATGEVTYPDEAEIDSATFLMRIGGLLSYLDDLLAPAASAAPRTETGRTYGGITITGSNVTLGDGSDINITTVTVEQVLHALERHIDKTVEDPIEKKTLMTKVNDLLRHPASTAVLQTALPELLKVLTR